MARWFNIGGPCNPATNYMLSAMDRLPDVASLVRKQQYFVVHAPRQCGKTTAFLSFANETNAKGDAVAMYCSLETVQEFPKAADGMPKICACLREAAWGLPGIDKLAEERWPITDMQRDEVVVSGVQNVLRRYAEVAGKPLYVLFDEVDCLGGETLITFLRQLRNGKIDMGKGKSFPASVALIGMRDIRDYKAKMRPDSETLGSASPFNVITEAMTLRSFTDEEVAALYAQHTAETGQVFEPEAVRHACVSSGGQPYLVNALARWCVEKIHKEDFSQPITFADMDEAKEKIIRERVTTLNSIQKRLHVDWMKRALRLIGRSIGSDAEDRNAVALAFSHGVVVEQDGILAFSCPIVRELVARHGYTAVA